MIKIGVDLLSNCKVSTSLLHTLHRSGPSSLCVRRMSDLSHKLKFDNRNLRSLPIDKEDKNYTRTVSGACYSRVNPTPVDNPVVVATSSSALSLLGLTEEDVKSPDFAQYFSGSKILSGSQPAAHCYCGHQFGHFSGQLGDGCAHYLGEVVNDRDERWELQLKGSGKTPYSRQADGRKVLRSSIREFLCSEAMHSLGIPTTRSGSCVTSDSKVVRDIFYSGNNIQEKVTIISRIAQTFIRFGSFEIFKTQDPTTMRTGPSVGLHDILYQLIDHTIHSYYPEISQVHPDDRIKRTGAFFKELCMRTAHLVAQWQCVGFCHGVLNTDNMSIVGVTLDYGPYGFMDMYNPGHICNGSDDGGRYAFDRQPSICKWNLQKLSEALSKCMTKEDIEEGLEMYDKEFDKFYSQRMRHKLGLIQKQLPDDSDLIEEFHQTLHKTGCDFTNGFRYLNRINLRQLNDPSHIESVVDGIVCECSKPEELIKTLQPKMNKRQLLQMKAMYDEAPMLMVQLGITGELLEQELGKIDALESIASSSVEDKREADKQLWMKWFDGYMERLKTEIEEIPQDQLEEANTERIVEMNKCNPIFILRNYLLQNAIEKAEKGDFSEVNRLLEQAQCPYTDYNDKEHSNMGYYSRPPLESLDLRVT